MRSFGPSPRPLHPFGSLELSSLRMEAGLTHEELRAFLGRSDRTLWRWRADGVPSWARTMLRMRAGHLDVLGWSGWQIVRGELYAPELEVGFRPQDLYELHWDRQLLKATLPVWVQKPGETA
jgi:transcriptional regulator with XRE-family HTH domain